MIGIFDCFGYGQGYDVPFEERYNLIKNAGFDSVMLWWSDKFGRGEGYQRDVQLARDAGLYVENIHAPIHEENYLSLDNGKGVGVFQCYLQCVKDCYDYGIPTMVLHLPDDKYPIKPLGKARLKVLAAEAEKYNIQIAFENLDNIRNLAVTLELLPSENVGFCYDSCHHANYSPGEDLLGQYGNRLLALHLQDNGGQNNQHQLPFDGNVDWETVMSKISLTGYKGVTALEPMNWDYGNLSIREFLDCAYQRAEKLDVMRRG